MYEQFFGLSTLPFALTPDTRFFCQAPPHWQALTMLMVCLKQGEGFVKLVGEIGSGKTLLCRQLLAELAKEQFITAYIPNPNLTPQELPRVLAKELALPSMPNPTGYDVQEQLLQHLLALHQLGKSVVIVIDEAQAMPLETLEALRLLTNLETETHKLWQVVLLGQPELDKKLAMYDLRQLQQRIVFSYYLTPFNAQQTALYIQHRILIAGHTYGALFNEPALRAIYRYSRGLPRLINVLAHKALLVAYGQGLNQVNKACVRQAVADTPVYLNPLLPWWRRIWRKLTGYCRRQKAL